MYYTAMPAGVAIIGTIYLIFKYCKYGKDIFLGLAFSAFGFFVKVFINTFCGYCVMAMGMTLVVLTLMQMVFTNRMLSSRLHIRSYVEKWTKRGKMNIWTDWRTGQNLKNSQVKIEI